MSYELEDIREFSVRRNWMTFPWLPTPEAYEQLKSRTLQMEARDVELARAFISGYLYAR